MRSSFLTQTPTLRRKGGAPDRGFSENLNSVSADRAAFMSEVGHVKALPAKEVSYPLPVRPPLILKKPESELDLKS
jgi:hypothetical protein